MKRSLMFEMLIIGIVLAPFAYLLASWNHAILDAQIRILVLYGLAALFFYFLPLVMQYLDSQKPNADFLIRSDKRIRLIWSSYLSALGFILFYYVLHDSEGESIPPRYLGVALSLFLFASGNFQSNLHPSSAFAGNNWFTKSFEEKNYRQLQRFTARLFFWVGIAGTAFFLYFTESKLVSWGLIFIGAVIFYGIVIRLIRNIASSR
ncbi:hypothetical protein [Emticicia sp. 21SJ11W-3]|uniref:hypothetical protein n=1 Tax=Emticicia sp. 21SJ11W-3 TaxID=2916755 RepID=UPI00209D62BF|nr:hypothetical protein [Emticicia sp. 21SJ11W-3]UTA69908.1 hypothetical protein MB380_08845 [Emticicia sp. 21SJ11W-3]